MTKRIALVTKGFTGSTFPLAKQLISKGYLVDIYLFYYISFTELEAFNCSYQSKCYGVEEIPIYKWIEMYEYLGNSDSVKLFSLKLPRPYNQIPILRNIVRFYSEWFVNKATVHMNKQNYEAINFIGGYYSNEYIPFLKKIKSKIIFSLHEVCNHFEPDFMNPSLLLKYLFKNKIDIIIYSEKSYQDILNYSDINIDKLHRINFGLFETFKTIPFKKTLLLPEKYFLFLGSILPYKGLSVLNESLKYLTDKLNGYNLVVAGKGNDSCIEELIKNNNVTFINKRLSNAELCEVVSGAMFAVCPYLTMSQSGIPQTVYAFGKPIIASDLDGFKEVVNSGKNGSLFEVGNSQELAFCIEQLLCRESILKHYSDEVKSFEKTYPEYSWSYIADSFINLFIER